ncbi:hypothetical protein A5710_04080 [Mycolicibacter sinensis]|uniref:Helix-turn-helix domain-containing protein n=1 Tax=Mycolicibacter sinensis (strain JDM601) TaxID=875328 RepID=A0A1A2XR07_MYCSD|nr:hypothetical protein A5710_04080 [Mycolicibacter sinensis]
MPLTSPWSPADNANDRLLDVSDAARIMGVKPATIRTWARRGYIGLDGTRQRLRLRGIDERGRRYYSWFDVAKAERATRDRAGRHFPRLTEDTEIF